MSIVFLEITTYIFHIRGICQYRSSACPKKVGMLKVKGNLASITHVLFIFYNTNRNIIFIN